MKALTKRSILSMYLGVGRDRVKMREIQSLYTIFIIISNSFYAYLLLLFNRINFLRLVIGSRGSPFMPIRGI